MVNSWEMDTCRLHRCCCWPRPYVSCRLNRLDPCGAQVVLPLSPLTWQLPPFSVYFTAGTRQPAKVPHPELSARAPLPPHPPSGCVGPPSAERLGDRSARHVHRAQLEEMSTSAVFVCDPMQLFMEIFCGLHANTYSRAAHWFVAKICIVLAKCLPVSVVLSLSSSEINCENFKLRCSKYKMYVSIWINWVPLSLFAL